MSYMLILTVALLAHMVVVTSHPENSVVHKRSIGGGGGTGGSGGGGGGGDDNRLVGGTGAAQGSNFVTANGTVVVAQTGGTATLPCVIRKHNSAVVNWIRKRDHHLLTVGGGTYSHDTRFLVRHARHVPAAWPLLIRKVQKPDAGYYECQLSTYPPTSILVQLKVVEAYAEVEGAPDLHVRSGSELRLVCKLNAATEPPSYVFWYHGSRMINYDQARGVKVLGAGAGAGSPAAPPPGGKFTSELLLKEATVEAAGNYSCVPSNSKPATITVHVHDDAACPPNSGQGVKTGPGSQNRTSVDVQGVKTGQDAGLIVQCPLATKDRQEVVPEKPSEGLSSASSSSSTTIPVRLFLLFVFAITTVQK